MGAFFNFCLSRWNKLSKTKLVYHIKKKGGWEPLWPLKLEWFKSVFTFKEEMNTILICLQVRPSRIKYPNKMDIYNIGINKDEYKSIIDNSSLNKRYKSGARCLHGDFIKIFEKERKLKKYLFNWSQ